MAEDKTIMITAGGHHPSCGCRRCTGAGNGADEVQRLRNALTNISNFARRMARFLDSDSLNEVADYADEALK